MQRGTTIEDVQFIDGIRFTRYKGNKYYWWKVGSNKHEWYRKGQSVSAHKYVWQKHNGLVPPGHHIHHKDHDASNNAIENLELVETAAHASYHAKKRLAENPAFRARFHAAGVAAAPAWHRSEEGAAWHREHAKRTAKTIERDGEELCCTWCGKPYRGVRSHTKRGFCGPSCQGAARKASGVDDEQRQCSECGTMFTANKYTKRKTCSKECAAACVSRAAKQRSRVQSNGGT